MSESEKNSYRQLSELDVLPNPTLSRKNCSVRLQVQQVNPLTRDFCQLLRQFLVNPFVQIPKEAQSPQFGMSVALAKD